MKKRRRQGQDFVFELDEVISESGCKPAVFTIDF